MRGELFEDMADADGFEVSRDSSDREILYAIWTRNEIGDLPSDEGWAILHERYPTELRFLLLNAYEELAHPTAGAWTASYFLRKLIRARKDAALARPIRDVLTIAWTDVFRRDRSALERREIAALAAELGVSPKEAPPADEDVDAAFQRLARFSSSVVVELHDETLASGSIGPPVAAAPTAGYHALLSRATKPARPYVAAETYAVGDLVRHPKFGLGVVTSAEPGRVDVLFESGARKLVCGHAPR